MGSLLFALSFGFARFRGDLRKLLLTGHRTHLNTLTSQVNCVSIQIYCYTSVQTVKTKAASITYDTLFVQTENYNAFLNITHTFCIARGVYPIE